MQKELTEEQKEVNDRIAEQLQSIPVLQKTLLIIEQQSKKLVNELATVSSAHEQAIKYIKQLEATIENLQKSIEDSKTTTEKETRES